MWLIDVFMAAATFLAIIAIVAISVTRDLRKKEGPDSLTKPHRDRE